MIKKPPSGAEKPKVKDLLGRKVGKVVHAITELRSGGLGWVPRFSLYFIASLLFISAYYLDLRGELFRGRGDSSIVGHVTRAYGTVKRVAWYAMSSAGPMGAGLDESWSRLESGKAILVPVRSGDLVQTGEESAAEFLFFGGNILQLEAGTLARFEEDEDEVTIRLILGRAFLELADGSSVGKRFVFRKGDGTLAEVPEGKKLVLSLSAVENLEDAVEIREVEAQGAPDAFESLELRLLAHGEEVMNRHPLLVRPIEESPDQDLLALLESREDRPRIQVPKPLFPGNESDVDVELQEGIAFHWERIQGSEGDPVIGYEVIVRPAPGYEVEDTARKVQVFKNRRNEFPIERVNGGGVFLWSVRAVTAKGQRGPASAPRWLEIKFPKRLRPPKIMKPKVE